MRPAGHEEDTSHANLIWSADVATCDVGTLGVAQAWARKRASKGPLPSGIGWMKALSIFAQSSEFRSNDSAWHHFATNP